MAIPSFVGSELDKNTNTFEDWFNTTNQIVTELGSRIVTVNDTASGGITTGNAQIVGVFSANTITASEIRGGSISNTDVLTISTDLDFTGDAFLANTSTYEVVSSLYTLTSNVFASTGDTYTINNTEINLNPSDLNVVASSNVSISSNNTSISSNLLDIHGTDLTVSSNTSFTGIDLTVSSNTSFTGTDLIVSSNASFTGSNTSFTGTDLTVSSNTSFTGTDLTVSSNTSFTGTDLTVSSNTSFTGTDFAVSSNTSFAGSSASFTGTDFAVSSNTSFTGNENFFQNSVTVDSDLTVNGNIITQGTTYSTTANSVLFDVDDFEIISQTTTINSNSFSINSSVEVSGSTDFNGADNNFSGVIVADSDITSNGTITAVDFNSTSDISLKENVKTLTNSAEIINDILPVSFNWKSNGEKSYGVIAQDIEKIIPDIVNEKDDGTKTVSYSQLTAFLIGAIKEQQNELNYIKSLLE
jgi:hypothetical protein